MNNAFYYSSGQACALETLGLTKTAKEYAPGIPKKKIDKLPEVKTPKDWQLVLQDHEADQAGHHYDLRLVDPETSKAHSWAIPSATMPDFSRSVLALQQPTHTADYALHFGEKTPQYIESGYGKGKVQIQRKEPIEVYHSKPEDEGTKVRFNIYRSTGPEEYAIVKTKQGDRLVNKTLTRQRMPELPIGKRPKMKEKSIDEVDLYKEDEVMMPKYDGAHTLLYLKDSGRIPRLFSYRDPKKHKAGVIEHTHKVPELLKTKTPDQHKRTIIRAETIGVDNNTGRHIPARQISGMLNASVPTSRSNQRSQNATLRPIMFDVDRYKGKDVTTKPYSTRYEILKEINRDTGIPITEAALDKRSKKKMVQDIKAGRHPLSAEGVMLRKYNESDNLTKAKIRPDHDVYVREIFEATDSSGTPKGRAGGFKYSWTQSGPIIGSIGTGFDHALAEDMLRHPSKYKGRVARVEAETVFPSGKLSKPSFKEWHLDKGE